MEKMIEIKSVVENGEFYGTIQTDDGIESHAKRYTDPELFATDVQTVYMDLFTDNPLSLERTNEADHGTTEVAETSEDAAE